MNSTHRIEVVPIKLEPHPNADSLSIIRVWGYTLVVKTKDWENTQIAAYCPPDSVLPDKPEYAFLGSNKRVKSRKFRGIHSQGLLVAAPEGSKIGDDVAEILGITHYEPPLPMSTGGEVERPPKDFLGSKYDIDAFRRYHHVFIPGETVFISEKIHGANSRYTFRDKMYCGSRTEWKRENPLNLWWQALQNTPSLKEFCVAFPGLTVYGEVYGQVQDLKYCGGINFAAFDLARQDGSWYNAEEGRELLEKHNVPCVPFLGKVPYNFEEVVRLAEGKTLVKGANHIREGCVVKPLIERFHNEVGRVILKVINSEY